jgi:hypothetical protein
MGFWTILPMAFVMVAGPQILTAVFLATSEQWKKNSLAFLGGAALSISIVVTAAYFVATGADKAGASHHSLYIVVLVLLLAAMIHAFVRRKQSEPPKWMGKLGTATPGTAFKLGFLLLGVFPTDILTSVAVGVYLRAHHDPLWHGIGFVALTLLVLGLPAIVLFAMGARGQRLLPRARNWMTTNAWIVNEIVLTFFAILVIKDLAA